MIREPGKKDILENYFRQLVESPTTGAQLAADFGRNSGRIGKLLVEQGVAANTDDVNTVMLTGFYHAYGPVNDYFN